MAGCVPVEGRGVVVAPWVSTWGVPRAGRPSCRRWGGGGVVGGVVVTAVGGVLLGVCCVGVGVVVVVVDVALLLGRLLTVMVVGSEERVVVVSEDRRGIRTLQTAGASVGGAVVGRVGVAGDAGVVVGVAAAASDAAAAVGQRCRVVVSMVVGVRRRRQWGRVFVHDVAVAAADAVAVVLIVRQGRRSSWMVEGRRSVSVCRGQRVASRPGQIVRRRQTSMVTAQRADSRVAGVEDSRAGLVRRRVVR